MCFSNYCPRFAEYQALYPASTRLQKALCDFHASIIRCCKHVLEIIRSDWKNHLIRALWSSIEKDFAPETAEVQHLAKQVTAEIRLAKDLVDHREQRLQALERAAAAEQRSMLQRFVPKVGRELDTLKRMQLEQSDYRDRKYRQRLMEFLSIHDYLYPYRKAFKERIRDTADWIFKRPNFVEWHAGNGPPLLWCSGKRALLAAYFIPHPFVKLTC
jgi:hypothetical protein